MRDLSLLVDAHNIVTPTPKTRFVWCVFSLYFVKGDVLDLIIPPANPGLPAEGVLVLVEGKNSREVHVTYNPGAAVIFLLRHDHTYWIKVEGGFGVPHLAGTSPSLAS
ncbi:hypothetical protein E2C01_059587 [Portunus trituberculatus]|uniref:Uncharacterized protein n=1 Tax=Portunus trituberculatus TaxID=210409 RepID=A0A5B7H5S0_PORTR|nr:hypothetical protein [Portunus trituberculatus]